MRIDLRETAGGGAYRWLASTVTPRPIAWVSTVSEEGVHNIAPISFFNVICDDPATFVIAIVPRPDASRKDTLHNAETTGELVVNLVNGALAEAMNNSSASLPPEVSEFEEFGIAHEPSELVAPWRVAGSPVAYECRVAQVMPYPAERPTRHLIFAEALVAHIDDAVLADETHVDPAKLDIVGRLGGNLYSHTREIFELKRPR